MSFIAFSTAAPQVGEEQPLSSTAGSVSSWTVLDISAAFPGGKTPYSAKALIILGADLPTSGLLGKMRVRKFGETTSYEEAPGALGITSIVYRDGGEYQSGGHLAIITIPVDTDGKFEYQLQNDSVAPRIMVRILEVTTIGEIEDPIPLAEKGAANGVASLNGSALVVEDPVNATATPTAGKIPKADGSGKLDGWVSIPSTFEEVGRITAGASHTGDTLLTKIGTITVLADSMGANGALRIFALFRATGIGTHTFKIQFGGNDIRRYWLAGVKLMVDFLPVFVWNKNATNSQESGILWHATVINTENPNLMAVDTTADVDVDFLVQNTDASAVAFLRYAFVEASFSN